MSLIDRLFRRSAKEKSETKDSKRGQYFAGDSEEAPLEELFRGRWHEHGTPRRKRSGAEVRLNSLTATVLLKDRSAERGMTRSSSGPIDPKTHEIYYLRFEGEPASKITFLMELARINRHVYHYPAQNFQDFMSEHLEKYFEASVTVLKGAGSSFLVAPTHRAATEPGIIGTIMEAYWVDFEALNGALGRVTSLVFGYVKSPQEGATLRRGRVTAYGPRHIQVESNGATRTYLISKIAWATAVTEAEPNPNLSLTVEVGVPRDRELRAMAWRFVDGTPKSKETQ